MINKIGEIPYKIKLENPCDKCKWENPETCRMCKIKKWIGE